ncbi:hypothetical protein SOASR030_36600 [Leminorella grimontii]|uniref:Uncharacterized protein n=1 Tax=Leminorella grimontii TaxID=82981 RepID=A0AAV5N9B8_9GAMM|nr:hypothetical protein [Leminorella grimontii]KFC92772.1 hypothetical protein GLGR_3647 [Leminorella grimontii ATCC 33999 = DSM 5078]GKX57548.1 hypothetical protein SOASR030_36600 [Leminorella grimontii]VFS62393.1 Uncharacterised protein [Leminorella grimontii]
MFKNLFGKKKQEQHYVTVTLNARLQPTHRGDLEDALGKVLEQCGIGHVSGGGSLLTDEGEISECDIEIDATDVSERAIGHILGFLEKALAPKGSRLRVDDRTIPFGHQEGLALYLNGTDLSDEVYQNSDVNVVWSEVEKALGEEGSIHSYHQGNKETALYLYGNSFDVMRALIQPFLDNYPLCQRCRVEQIA